MSTPGDEDGRSVAGIARAARPLRVALVADDLTGAMDAAAPFARRGATVRVLSDAAALDEADDSMPDVLALSTNSRHLSAPEAEKVVAAALRRLSAWHPRLLFKKIDSTLRGNVAAETAAALDATGRRVVVATPAVPAQGRTLRDGAVYVNGIPLRDTPVARDAIAPPPDRPLQELLRERMPDLPCRVVARNETPCIVPKERQALIIDAESAADLERIAALEAAHPGEILWVGAAGLGDALATVTFQEGAAPAPRIPADHLLLFLIGSRTDRTATQARLLAARPGTCWRGAPDGRIDPVALLRDLTARERTDALVLQAQPGEGGRAALDVAADLSAAAAAVLRAGCVGAVIATGGDTAAALLGRLGLHAIELRGELLPGIALGWIEVAGRRIPLVTKSGGFGDDRVFLTLAELLRGTGT